MKQVINYGVDYGKVPLSKLPKGVMMDGRGYTGEAFFINGFNGYTSTEDDGLLAIHDTHNKEYHYLTDKEGRLIRATDRRGQTINF